MPSGVTEDVHELFIDENKLDLALSDANILPTVNITKVTKHSRQKINKMYSVINVSSIDKSMFPSYTQ